MAGSNPDFGMAETAEWICGNHRDMKELNCVFTRVHWPQDKRILEFCDLEFEPGCVEFYKTKRSVRTPSSEQVRKAIFREGLNQWRNYDLWLGPLRESLGDALTRYRSAPALVTRDQVA